LAAASAGPRTGPAGCPQSGMLESEMSAMFPDTSTDSRGTGAWLARLVFGALLLLGILAVVLYAGARFILWPNADSVVGRYAGTVEQRLGTRLTWKAIHTEWTGLRPTFEIVEPVL